MKQSLALGLMIAALSAPALATTVATPSVMDAKPEKGQRSKQYIDRMWKEMDSNNDGAISSAESAEFGERKFKERDINKDGSVTREEWEGFHKSRMKDMRGKMDRSAGEATPLPDDGKPPVTGSPSVPPAEKMGAPIEKK